MYKVSEVHTGRNGLLSLPSSLAACSLGTTCYGGVFEDTRSWTGRMDVFPHSVVERLQELSTIVLSKEN